RRLRSADCSAVCCRRQISRRASALSSARDCCASPIIVSSHRGGSGSAAAAERNGGQHIVERRPHAIEVLVEIRFEVLDKFAQAIENIDKDKVLDLVQDLLDALRQACNGGFQLRGKSVDLITDQLQLAVDHADNVVENQLDVGRQCLDQ